MLSLFACSGVIIGRALVRRSHDAAGRVWRLVPPPSLPKESPCVSVSKGPPQTCFASSGLTSILITSSFPEILKGVPLGHMPIDPSGESPHLCPLRIGSDTPVVPQGTPCRSDPRSSTDKQAFTVYLPKFRGFPSRVAYQIRNVVG
jgi:hypothetical protein